MVNTENEGGSVQFHYDWSAIDPSYAVIDAIAALEDVDPIDLPTTHDVTLYDFVEPEALDSIVTEASEIEISFGIYGYGVTIQGNAITVSEH